MSEWPLIVIMLLTYRRVDYALRTIKATKSNLFYPNLKWFVADNGSSGEQMQDIFHEIGGENILSFINIQSPEGTSYAGECWNVATKDIYNHTDIIIRLEDDWELRGLLDIRPYAMLLREHHEFGMVRLGYQHVPANMEAIGVDGVHYLRYDKSSRFVHGGHPALIHRRYHEAYGLYHEERNPGEIEIEFDERVRATKGPEVIRPMDIGGNGAYHHFGTEKAY